MLKNLQNSDHLQVGLQWKLLPRQVDEIAPGVLPQVLKASLSCSEKNAAVCLASESTGGSKRTT